MTKIGRIYKIVCSQSDDVYIGSTFNTLRDRFRTHKVAFCRWSKDDTLGNYAIYPYFKQYGVENFKIILIKEYTVEDRSHLEAYEQLWINKLKCVNQQSAFRINKFAVKDYNKENADIIKAKKRQFYHANKQRIRALRNTKHECE